MNVPVLDREVPGHEMLPPSEIDGANVRIYYLSRSWTCLTLVVISLIAAGIFLGRLLSVSQPGSDARDAGEILQSVLRDRRPDVTLATECLLRMPGMPSGLTEEIARANFAPGPRALVTAVAGSMRDGFHEPNAQLLILAHQFPPEPGANACVGEIFAQGMAEPTAGP